MKNLGVEVGKKKEITPTGINYFLYFLYLFFFVVVINGGSKQPHVKMP